MAIDPSIALQTKGITTPDPMTMASQGLTLSNLGMQNQQMQYQAQAQRDVPAALALAAQFKDPEQAIQAVSQQYPRAAQVIVPMIRDNALKIAQTGEASGKGEQARQTAYKEAAGVLGNQVNGLMQSGQPLTPMQKQQIAAQASHVAQIGGHSAEGVPSVMAPDAQWQQFLQGIAMSSVNPEQQASMRKTTALLPGELDQQRATLIKTGAETGKTSMESQQINQNMQFKPQEVANQTTSAQASATSAGAAAKNADTTRGIFLQGKEYTNPLTGQAGFLQPGGLQGGPSTAVPAVGADGQPVKVGMSSGDTALAASRADRVKAAGASQELADRVMTITPALRQLAQSGYNGPLAGSDTGKMILQTLSSAGALSPSALSKLQNMRASDALTMELLGPLAHEFSARGSNMALKTVMSGKPGSENSLPARLAMIDALEMDARNLKQHAGSLNTYVGQNPGDVGLTGYKPPSPEGAQIAGKPAAPKLGEVRHNDQDGKDYLYNGGDQYNRSSWKQVGP